MALCIKEQVFSSVKKYTITDESGQLRYTTEGRAKGQFIVVGNQIHIFDPLGIIPSKRRITEVSFLLSEKVRKRLEVRKREKNPAV